MTNGGFSSPAANAEYGPPLHSAREGGFLVHFLAGMTGWSLVVTLLLVLVVYDQCKSAHGHFGLASWALADWDQSNTYGAKAQ